MEVRSHRIKTFLRSVLHQQDRGLVSSLVNEGRDVDPIRGGAPIALLLQAFPSNGDDVKGPVFHAIEVTGLGIQLTPARL